MEEGEGEEYSTPIGSPDQSPPTQSHMPRPDLPLAGQCAGESSAEETIADEDLFGGGPSVDTPPEPSGSSPSSLVASSSVESFVLIPSSDSSDTDSNPGNYFAKDYRFEGGTEWQTVVQRKQKPPPVAPKPQNMDSTTGDGLESKEERNKKDELSDGKAYKEDQDGKDQRSARNDNVEPEDDLVNKDEPKDVKDDNGSREDDEDDNADGSAVKDDSAHSGHFKDEKIDHVIVKDDNRDQDLKDLNSNGDDIDNQVFKGNQGNVKDDSEKYDNDDEKLNGDNEENEVDDKDVKEDNVNKDTEDDTEENVLKMIDESIDKVSNDEGNLDGDEDSAPQDDSSEPGGVHRGLDRGPDHAVDDDDDTEREHALSEKDDSSTNNIMRSLSSEILQDLPTVEDDQKGNTESSLSEPMQSTEQSEKDANKLDPEFYGPNQEEHNPSSVGKNLHNVHSNVQNQFPQSHFFERENMAKEVSCRSAESPLERQQTDNFPPREQNQYQPFAPNLTREHRAEGQHPDNENQGMSNIGFDGRQGVPQSIPSNAVPIPTSNIGNPCNPLPPPENIDPSQQEQQQQQYLWQQQQQPQEHQHQQSQQHPHPQHPYLQQQFNNQQFPTQQQFQHQIPQEHGQPYYHDQPQQQNPQYQQHRQPLYQDQLPYQHLQYQQHQGQSYYQHQLKHQHQYQQHFGHQQHKQNVHQPQYNEQEHPLQEQVKPQHLERGPLKTVRVEGVTKDLSKDTLELYFESKKRSHGGEITCIKMDEDRRIALIEFSDHEVAKRVAEKKEHQLAGRTLIAVLHDPQLDGNAGEASENRGPLKTVRVEGVTKDLSKDTLELYFESKKRSRGGEITCIKMDEDRRIALIEFSDHEVAKRVAEKKEHQLAGRTLIAVLHDPQLDGNAGEASENRGPVNTVRIDGITKDITQENLELYFENKRRSGGGEISSIKLYPKKGMVLIVFADAEAAVRVSTRKTHVVKGKKLQATLHDETHGSTSSNTVKVTGLSPSVDDETIELYFENKRRSNGGVITEIRMRGNAVYITFQEPGVAQKVATKTDHTLKGVKLAVQLDDPALHVSDKNTLVVKNYQPVSPDTVSLYFENKRRTGGGEHEMKEEKGKIYLTFQSEEVVERVLKHCPHKVEGKTLTVTRLDEEAEDSGEDEKPRTTISVSGYKKGCSDDSISLYFENRRKSGGGDIVGEVRRHPKKDIVYIEFEDEEVAKRVVSRTHTLTGNDLKVELVEPQVMYKNKALISGVPEIDSSESLVHYLEGRTKKDVSQILFGEEPGEIVVSFGDESECLDFAEFEKQLGKKPFKHGGRSVTLKVSQVPQTKSVTVQDIPPNSSEDQIRLYFENKKRSGGGDVGEVVVRPDEKYAVVTFTEVEVAEAVCQREHIISKVRVKASLCFECLGEKGGSLEPPVTRLPDPLTMSGINRNILRYLTSNEYGQDVKDKALEKVKAKSEVDVGEGMLTFVPAFDLSLPDAKRLVKTWTENVEESWRAVSDCLEMKTIQANSEIWSELKSSLKPVDKQIEVFTEDPDFTIVVVGPKAQVSDVASRLETVKNTIQVRCDKRKTQVSHQMKLQPPQLMLLVKQRILDHLSLDDLKLNFKFETGEITLTGQEGDITKAKTDIWEEVNKIKIETVVSHFTLRELEFLRQEHVERFLQKQMDEHSTSVEGCWERGTEGLKVYYFTNKGLEDVKRYLKGAVKETVHKLDPENLPLLQSSKFKNLIDQLTREHNQRLVIQTDLNNRQMVIIAVSNEANHVAEQITDFLKMNSVYNEIFKGDKMKIKFIILHCQDRLKSLETDLKDIPVNFTISTSPEYTIRLQSTKDGCPLARRRLQKIVGDVRCYKRDLERPGLKEFLKSDEILQRLEKETRCVIDIDGGTNFEDEDVYEDFDFTHSILFECQFDEDRSLQVAVGEMTSLANDVEAVIVEVSSNLNSDSRHSWEVMQKAGDKPTSELRRFARGQDIMEGEVFCTSPGNLRCRNIIHVVSPCSRYRQKDAIASSVVESLQEAVKKNLRSVALPSFFTGNVTSTQDALRGVVEGVHMFYRQNRNSSITDTYLCLETWEHCQSLWDIAVDVFGPENIRNNEGMSTGDSLHGGNRRGMGLRRESIKDLEHSVPEEAEIQNFPEGLKDIPRPRILLVEADMGVEEADVIVNSTSTTLNLSNGQVSKSLLKNAGPAIQAECSEKYPKGIKMGDIAVTKGGNMQCVKVIYHCTLPQWKDGTGEKTFTNVMNALLKKANDEKMETMAIPALGTGNLGYSRQLVAKLMYQTVTEFCKNTPEATIKDVLFIVYPKDLQTIEAFEVEHRQYMVSIGGKVPASKSEIKKERTEELEAYRAKQGYIDKFGEVVSKVTGKAKTFLSQKKPAQPSKKPPVANPAPPTPNFSRQGTLPRSQYVSKATKVNLCFYTDHEHVVSKAVNWIYDSWDKNSLRKEIKESTVQQWTDEQINELRPIENKHSVSIKVFKTRGKIEMFGLKRNVVDANMELLEIIRRIEKEQKDKENADYVKKFVQWFYEEIKEDGEEKMVPYETDINFKLERAFRQEERKQFSYMGYVFDFEKWVEYPEHNEEDALKMIRKDKVKAANEKLPSTWENMSSSRDMEIKQVSMNSQEFATVKTNFMKALSSNVPANVVRVDRIQSKTLFQQYQAKMEQLRKENPGVEVERTLWHGTNKDAAMSIAKLGFNRSYCDKEQNAYGEGVYFTSDAGYAARSQYAPADAQGKRHIIQSKVLTGSFTQGLPKMRVPPAKDSSNIHNLYDSVVDDPSNPKIFVIFGDTQAYPEYLITFQ